MKKKIVFSGIQPTGELTIGHYLGVISKWVVLQNKFKCFYCIADLHSLTKNVFFSKKKIFDLVASFLALGLNFKKCVIFLQSEVYEHTYLYWMLNCLSYTGELNRMTQYKSKILDLLYKNNIGLYTYPVLMAADILLYQSNYVSVGLDQIQHIEYTKVIARRFNKLFKDNIFVIPNYLLSLNSKIMSLLDPQKKMSKSDLNINNYISLFDSPDLVYLKIKNSLTDSDNPCKIIYDVVNKPGISNLLNIVSGLLNISRELLVNKFIGFNYTNFKYFVSEKINNFLLIFKKKFLIFRSNKKLLVNILKTGRKIAKEKAQKTLNLIKNNII